MENPAVTELRSRSRSKTPFLRSSCDRENCMEGEDHTHHKTGRKTPVKRNTPVKQLHPTTNKTIPEPIIEIDDDEDSPPAHRTRHSTRIEKQVKTSDYSSEENTDPPKGQQKEIYQNVVNSRYERAATSSHHYSFADINFSPINTSHNVTHDRSFRIGSPTYSACSTDSSFAEQALADTSALLERDPSGEHLPSRLYKMAGEYWNKYPKTDYTYSPLSKDRVELAPGQVAVPNMSRRSLSQFRIQGPNTSVDEMDRLTGTAIWRSSTVRKRYTSVDSSDDESAFYRGNGGYPPAEQRWLITRFLLAVITTITTTVSSTYRKIVGPSHRYPYTDRRPAKAGFVSQAASVAAAPFYWIYTMIKSMVTTTVTTVTETITPNHVSQSEKYTSHSSHVKTVVKQRRWPWFLLLLLPLLAYGSHYTYENWDHMVMPNLTDFQLDLSEFSPLRLTNFTLPNITNLSVFPNLTLPDINITLPDIRDNLPEMSKTYKEYKDIVQNRMADASDYAKIVMDSCYEEMRRFWRGVIG